MVIASFVLSIIAVLVTVFNCYMQYFYKKNWYKAQRKAKFYINKCRSASCMQGGLKQASA